MATIESVKLVRAFDRDTGAALLVNGVPVAAVNYDEHGSAGDDILAEVLSGLAQLANVFPETDEVSDDEFIRMMDGETS